MATLAATQTELIDALKSVLELEHNALEGYKETIKRLKNEDHRDMIAEFSQDHERHVQDLTEILAAHNVDVPKDPTMVKQWMTKGKVMLADIGSNMVSDEADKVIMRAMYSNEEDTVTAYQRMCERADVKDEKIKKVLEKGLHDEQRHRKAIGDAISTMD